MGSAGLALGGATYRDTQLRDTQLGEKSARCRPGASLVAIAGATIILEGGGFAGGDTTPCQGGGRARPDRKSVV